MNNTDKIREINAMRTFSDSDVSEKEIAIAKAIFAVFSYVEIDTIEIDVTNFVIESHKKYNVGCHIYTYHTEAEVFVKLHKIFEEAKTSNDMFCYPTSINVNNFSVNDKVFTIELDISTVI